MRLLAAGLTALWAATSLLVLVAYRPGGPADLLEGVGLMLTVGIAAMALAGPPAAHGPQAFRLIAALAMGTGLILLPSLASLWRQIAERGEERRPEDREGPW